MLYEKNIYICGVYEITCEIWLNMMGSIIFSNWNRLYGLWKYVSDITYMTSYMAYNIYDLYYGGKKAKLNLLTTPQQLCSTVDIPTTLSFVIVS